MRVLVTGDAGHVGQPVVSHLTRAGHTVVDSTGSVIRISGISTTSWLSRPGCDAVVHAAALAHDTAGTPEQMFAVNVTGTWNALRVAEAVSATVFVYFSSAQVFGTAEGESAPEYLPVDDHHPRNATRPYGLSKCFGEDLCRAMTRRTGIATVVLRPVGVWNRPTYEEIFRARQANPTYEWSPFWELGGFVDARNVATAVEAALAVAPGTHERVLLCSSDISASEPTLAMVERLLPRTAWRQDARGMQGHTLAALFDTSAAKAKLGWAPIHTWQEWLREHEGG